MFVASHVVTLMKKGEQGWNQKDVSAAVMSVPAPDVRVQMLYDTSLSNPHLYAYIAVRIHQGNPKKAQRLALKAFAYSGTVIRCVKHCSSETSTECKAIYDYRSRMNGVMHELAGAIDAAQRCV